MSIEDQLRADAAAFRAEAAMTDAEATAMVGRIMSAVVRATDRAVLQVGDLDAHVRLRRTGLVPWLLLWGPPGMRPGLVESADEMLTRKGSQRISEWEPMFGVPAGVRIGAVMGAYHCRVEHLWREDDDV